MFGIEYISQSSYNLIAVISALLVMLVASITDFQKREVADMINYGLFFSAIALRLLYSAITQNPLVILDGIIGFAITLAIALSMFYTGQWGGGDSKMIMGLGVLFGLKLIPFNGLLIFNSTLISFIINAFIAGSIFGLVWSLVTAFKDWKKFIVSWKKTTKDAKTIKRIFIIIALLLIIAGLIFKEVRLLLILIALLFLMTIYMYIFAKSVEKGSMVKMLAPSKVTEGDWIDKDVKYKGKYLCGPKDLGISKKQITLLKKHKIRRVPVKIGIPFIPSFLLGFIITLLFGNLMTLVIITMVI